MTGVRRVLFRSALYYCRTFWAGALVIGDATGADLWPAISRSAVVAAALSVAAAVPLVGFLAAPAATRSVLWSSRGTEGRRDTSVAQARPVVQTAEDCERRTVISNKR